MGIMTLSRLHEYPGYPEGFPDRDLYYLLSQYLHGERFAVKAAEKAGASIPLTNHQLPDLIKSFQADETKHVALIEAYLIRRFGSIQEHHEGTAKLCRESLEQDSFLPSAVMLHGVIEPFGLGSLLGIRKFVREKELCELIDIVSRDESRHLEIGQELLFAELGDLQISWAVQRQALNLFKELCDSTLAKPVFEEFFPQHWEAEIWIERAVRSDLQKRQSRLVLSTTAAQMKKLGFAEDNLRSVMSFARDFAADPLRSNASRVRPAKKSGVVQSSHPHYDDGNLLFQDILGPTMAYSCGNWYGQENLDHAQIAKFKKIARLSGISERTKSVLDCRCGWGGYLKHLNENFPNLERIEGVTVSQEQW